MVFGFFKKSGPSPEEEQKLQGAFFRRLINEDREKHNEEKIDDQSVMAGNFAFNEVLNAAAVWKKKKDLENDWNRFELAVLMMFMTRHSKTTADLLGLNETQAAQVCALMPSDLLFSFCGACPNLGLNTLIEDWKLVDSTAMKKFGSEKLENGFKHAFMLSMSDLNDGGKTTAGREQLHHFMTQVENCVREVHPHEIKEMENTPPEITYYQLITGETLQQTKNSKIDSKGSEKASRAKQEAELAHLKSLFEKGLITENVYDKRQQEILRKLDVSEV